MGVRGLRGLMIDNGLCRRIFMIQEIREHRRRLPRETQPIIIFDLLALAYSFLHGLAGLLGGRHKIFLETIEKFFRQLHTAGASLIFFCDGQLQTMKTEEWCNRRNQRYSEGMKTMQDSTKVSDDNPFKCTSFFESVTKLAENFGIVRVSTEVECDRAIAKYALENSPAVLAIVSSDTDMLIFDSGLVQMWTMELSDFRQCEALRFDRSGLLDFLELTGDQMKLFATIVGNDFTKKYIFDTNAEMRKIKPTEVAPIVKELLHAQRDMGNLCKIVAEATLRNGCHVSAERVKSVEESLAYYELNFSLEPRRRINVLKNCLENGLTFQYDVQFLDFKQRCCEKFICIILQAIERAGGILTEQQPENSKLNKIVVLTKTSADEGFEEIALEPTLPLHSVRYTHQNGDDFRKWADLLHCLGLQLQVDKLRNMNQTNLRILLPILSIKFLLQAKEVTKPQADALLLANCEDPPHDLPVPTYSEPETIRTAQAFDRTVTLVDDLFHICGLSEHLHPISYDGFYYDHLCKTRQNLESRIKRRLNFDAVAIYNNN